MHIFGVINSKYTDIEKWFNLLENNTDRWYYNNGCFVPKIGDFIYVYLSNKKGIICCVKCIGYDDSVPDNIIYKQIESDIGDRQSRQFGKSVVIELVQRYVHPKNEPFERKNLTGRRQDTFKIALKSYFDVFNFENEDIIQGDEAYEFVVNNLNLSLLDKFNLLCVQFNDSILPIED